LLELLVQLEAVVAGHGTEHAAASREQRGEDAARTGPAGTLLLLQLAGRTGHLVTLLRLVRALTTIGQILLHIEVDRVVVGLDTENLVFQNGLLAGLLA